jgi:hypothetical protein
MTREEIKNNLDHGDYVKIARICSTSNVNVSAYFNGHRKGISAKYKHIHQEGERIATINLSQKQPINTQSND